MGCAKSTAENGQKNAELNTKKPTSKQQITSKGNPEYPPIEDLDSLNSKKAKVMTLLTGEKDYNPREENYLKCYEELKLPLSTDEDQKVEIEVLNESFKILPIKQNNFEAGRYRVPKIVYPRLELGSLGKKNYEDEVKAENG